MGFGLMKFIKGAYNLPPIYIDGELSLKHNIGAIVKKLNQLYIINEKGLEEIKYG